MYGTIEQDSAAKVTASKRDRETESDRREKQKKTITHNERLVVERMEGWRGGIGREGAKANNIV